MAKNDDTVPQIEEAEQIEVARKLDPEAPIEAPEALDPKTANIVYHDWEASQYDGKWNISFDERCVEYARDKFTLVAPEKKYGKVLEIGAGTGFFVINLALAGLVHEPYATDISPGMVDVCLRNAQANGINNMKARTADAEALPFEDGFFDLVIGHAVLHHLPDVEAAFAEAFRVLKPGGIFVVAGEPTRLGFQVVQVAKRTTAKLFKTIGPRLNLMRAEQPGAPESALEAHVDLHEFHPHMVKGWLTDAGFTNVKIETDELLSGVFGWSVRTIEALARPGLLGEKWAYWAYRNYMRIYKLDDVVLRRLVPKPFFYNLLFAAEKPKED